MGKLELCTLILISVGMLCAIAGITLAITGFLVDWDKYVLRFMGSVIAGGTVLYFGILVVGFMVRRILRK